jgi:trehalose/maltose hydrolase-like predicted phosphorylase
MILWSLWAEIILDTARFGAAAVEWNEESNRFEINEVIGPDEKP